MRVEVAQVGSDLPAPARVVRDEVAQSAILPSVTAVVDHAVLHRAADAAEYPQVELGDDDLDLGGIGEDGPDLRRRW